MNLTCSRARRLAAITAITGFAGLAGQAAAFTLSSPAFEPGGTIPQKHTCDGSATARERHAADTNAGVSPALVWRDSPSATKAFALVVDDPDTPTGSYVYWVLYDIPASQTSLSEGVARSEELPDGSKQGRNDFRNPFYQGPCPPRGDPLHRFVFTLYALAAPLDLPPAATKTAVMQAINRHKLGKAELIGQYGR
ncbi:MAG: YbhB/YbcL family Raf kinase inhibitor-like protein [Deltaproteobacteria bacterium]|nr:YbhB/YbcL family Raf kinase inhibitor-like protein [Deltaproteobacteria bacterium]